MKKIIIICLTLVASVSMAQTKPRKVVIKRSVTIHKDSIAYLPDTIPVVFKELVIKPDTIYEKWNKGYVVWQTWYLPNVTLISTSFAGAWTSSVRFNDPQPYENKYNFSEAMEGKFLYSDYKPVTNKVIYSIAK